MSKDTLSLYLPTELIAAVRGEAERQGISVSELAERFLNEALQEHRAYVRTLERVKVLESLPTSLVDVPMDHPIYARGVSGDGPFEVKVSYS